VVFERGAKRPSSAGRTGGWRSSRVRSRHDTWRPRPPVRALARRPANGGLIEAARVRESGRRAAATWRNTLPWQCRRSALRTAGACSDARDDLGRPSSPTRASRPELYRRGRPAEAGRRCRGSRASSATCPRARRARGSPTPCFGDLRRSGARRSSPRTAGGCTSVPLSPRLDVRAGGGARRAARVDGSASTGE